MWFMCNIVVNNEVGFEKNILHTIIIVHWWYNIIIFYLKKYCSIIILDILVSGILYQYFNNCHTQHTCIINNCIRFNNIFTQYSGQYILYT